MTAGHEQGEASGSSNVGLAPSAVVEEAEGLRLHLSSRNSTGYVGVYVDGRRDGRFRVILTLDSKQQTVGIFGTAVEGAVAYARAVGGEQARAGRAEAEARSAAAHSADPARRGQRSLAQAGIEEAAGSAAGSGLTKMEMAAAGLKISPGACCSAVPRRASSENHLSVSRLR